MHSYIQLDSKSYYVSSDLQWWHEKYINLLVVLNPLENSKKDVIQLIRF
jgi:hypothetical protein